MSERSESKGIFATPSEGQFLNALLLATEDDGIVVHVPWVYIVRCSDDSLYIGHTDDVVAREATHNAGDGSRYTALKRPVRVVYSEHHASMKNAIARERQLKRWTARKKEALIAGDVANGSVTAGAGLSPLRSGAPGFRGEPVQSAGSVFARIACDGKPRVRLCLRSVARGDSRSGVDD